MIMLDAYSTSYNETILSFNLRLLVNISITLKYNWKCGPNNTFTNALTSPTV